MATIAHMCAVQTMRGNIYSIETSAEHCIWSGGRLIRRNHHVPWTFNHTYGVLDDRFVTHTDVRLQTRFPQMLSDGQSGIQRIPWKLGRYFPNEIMMDHHPSLGARVPFYIVLRTTKILIRDMLYANGSYEPDGS